MGLNVANTIRAQLGGGKFDTMTGARQWVGGDNWVQFKLPSNFAKGRINCVKITLTPADLYEIEYFNIRGLNVKSVAKSEGIYVDMLRQDFTEKTGLYITL